jgi:hypothetical protein
MRSPVKIIWHWVSGKVMAIIFSKSYRVLSAWNQRVVTFYSTIKPYSYESSSCILFPQSAFFYIYSTTQFIKSPCHTHCRYSDSDLKVKAEKMTQFLLFNGEKNVSSYRNFESLKFNNKMIPFKSPHGCRIVSTTQW